MSAIRAKKAHGVQKALQDAQLAAQHGEAQRAHKAVEAQAHKRLAKLWEDRELRELELKSKQETAHLEAEIEAKKEAAMRTHELKMAGLGRHPSLDRAGAFDPARNIRLVPPLPRKRG